jgi:hypothetical protein
MAASAGIHAITGQRKRSGWVCSGAITVHMKPGAAPGGLLALNILINLQTQPECAHLFSGPARSTQLISKMTEKAKPVFKKVEELRPGTWGHNLHVKVQHTQRPLQYSSVHS